MAFESSRVEFESSIEQRFHTRSSKFSSSIEHTPLLDSNSKISIEQTSLWDSTQFEFDRAEGSVRLELDMLDSKSLFHSKYQNYETFNKIIINTTFYDSPPCPPMVDRLTSFQSYYAEIKRSVGGVFLVPLFPKPYFWEYTFIGDSLVAHILILRHVAHSVH
jgi:hypothetical protein